MEFSSDRRCKCTSLRLHRSANRKTVVIHIPYRLRKAYHKIHVRIVRELEKKFSGKVFLDPKERNNMEYKLESFSAVYSKL